MDVPDSGHVLVPTGNDASAYVAVRSLSARGVGTLVASEKPHPPAAASRFCDEAVDTPPPREDLLAYRDALLALAAREDVTAVVPVRPEDSYVLSRYRDEFEREAALFVPSMDRLEAVQDRRRLADAAAAAGVPVPETRPLSTLDDWPGDCIVKSRYNVLADAYLDATSPEEIAVVKDIHHVRPGDDADPDRIRAEMRHDPIVQEFVPKDGEYMVGALCDHGEVLASFQHYQVRGNSYTGGGGVYRQSMYDPALARVARDLLAELEFHGLACIEYMRHADTGEYVLTEVNPRLWQSLPSTVHAGADFPWYYWLAAMGRADAIEDDYEMGVGTHLLHGEVGHFASVLTEESPHVDRPSVLGTAWRILASCGAEPRFDYLRLDDPRPFLAGVRSALS